MNLEVIFFSAKCIGAALVVVGCVGAGFFKSAEVTGRIEELKEMHRLMLLLRGEIGYLAQPMPEAMAKAAGRCRGKYRLFFEDMEHQLYEKSGESFAEIWRHCVDKYFSGGSMKDEDLKLLCNIGENMGFMDKQTQVSALDLYMENLKISIQYLTETAAAKQRVYKCVGAFSGLLAVILLI